MAQVYVVNISEILEETKFLQLKEKATEECKKRLERFRFKKDVQRCLYGISLIQYILKKKYGAECKDYAFRKNPYGKPYIEGHPAWQFNISHSGNWVVCGFSEYAIGVDIEQSIPCNKIISEQIFTPLELSYFMCLNEEEQTELFFQLWTLKESYVKYKGMGFQMPFNQVAFSLKDNQFQLELNERQELYLYTSDFEKGYKMAVCSQDKEVEVIYLSLKEMYEELCKDIAVKGEM